ncbi:MAG: Na+/H+ antiporter NhaC family protein [Lentihominibacter sp.]|jgi:tetracycline resistance efflux pump
MKLKELLEQEVMRVSGRRSFFVALLIIIITYVLTYTVFPEDPAELGVLTLVPSLFLMVYIFVTQRILEALTLVSIMGFIMVDRTAEDNVLLVFSDSLLTTMMSEDIAWLFIVCGLMGSIINLMERSGGAMAFGNFVLRIAKTKRSALMWTWIVGLALFVDDYLNSMARGVSMSPVTDRYGTSREYLSYVVSSTAAPMCVLMPITTWAAFCSRLLEANGWAPPGKGIEYFVMTIPYNYYAWAAVIMVPLVIMGVIPLFGPMRKAEKRVADGGPVAPPGSEKIDIKAGVQMEVPDNPKVFNFFLPMIVLVAATVFFGNDMMMGVLVTMGVSFVAYLLQNLMSAEEFTDVSLHGIKNMIYPLLLMVLAFVFADMNERIGFTTYVIESASAIMTPQWMPVVLFFVLALTQIVTGTNWGMYVIALPIVLPLVDQVGGSPVLAVAAVLSAGVLGSHVCFFSDCTVVTSAASGCNNFDHAWTQMPLGLLAGVFASIGFIIAGFTVG